MTALAGVVMAVGIAGVVVPGLPGTALVLVAGVGWAWLTDAGAGGWAVVAVMAVVFVIGAVLKYVLPGRRLQGDVPRRTLVVAAVCAVVGLLVLPPVGLLVGGLLGTYASEAQRLHDGRQAVGATVRVLKAVGVGMLAELTAGVLMMAVWLVGVLAT